MPAGVEGIIKKIRETVGDLPVYLSIDVRIERSPTAWVVAHFAYAEDRFH